MYTGHHAKNPLFLSDFKEILIFLTDFQEISKYHVPQKIRPVGAKLFHADGQMDGHDEMVAFHDFVNVPKKWCTITKDM